MLDPMNETTCPPPWDDAANLLLSLEEEALATDVPPTPLLLAYAGDAAIATVRLRPFPSGGLLDALIEVLSLLLHLGVDRVALALPGRAWSLDDPIPPVSDEVDLRVPVVVLALADAHDGPCQLTTRIHPYRPAEGFDGPLAPDERPEAPALEALTLLLDNRGDLAVEPDLRVAAQLARLLLRGHLVALEPGAAARLELATGV